LPELPEVETVARQLAPLLTGRLIRGVAVLDPKLDALQLAALRGATITGVSRYGKQIALALARKRSAPASGYLLVHLRMTGRLIWDEQRDACELKHLRLRLELDRGSLLFYDPRRFGTCTIAQELDHGAGAGLEPLGPGYTLPALRELLDHSRQPLKTWLLRQDKLVGLGNIYASEILFAARLHPQRQAGGLSAQEQARLYRAIPRILKLAIQHCGTTFSDFQDAHGVTGRFQRLLKVYGRENEQCKNCQSPIARLVQQQRSTFYCPACQRP
jgi:formamidopyrimidine-DNA glycosylase